MSYSIYIVNGCFTTLVPLTLSFYVFMLHFHFTERVLILVPSIVPFTVEIESCKRIPLSTSSCPHDRLIGMTDVVREMADLVRAELNIATVPDARSRPLMISRLARGGKTTTLSCLFDELKRRLLRVIFITFNGSSNFETRQGESQRNAILRVIATQLVEIGNSDPLDIECDEHALDEYIGKFPFVLLIDELNALAAPVDAEAGRMLRRLFMDKLNRCLVFTSHVPMSLETRACLPSPRGCLTVPFHPTLDITSLRAMSDMCRAITPAEVMMYGGIPSLIYSVKAMHEMTPKERFSNKFGLHSCDPDLLKFFVLSVVMGERRGEIALFDEFSIVSEGNKIRWPLCYIACILKAFKQNEATRAVCDYCDSLSTYAQATESGKEWECVLNIAIIFRCLYQSYWADQSPFTIVPPGIEPKVMCSTIPHEFQTLPQVMGHIADLTARISVPCLMVLVPAYSKFPDVDGFVVYCGVGAKTLVYGYQAKTGRAYPKKPAPKQLTKALLLRGKSPAKGSLQRGWAYMSREGVERLLGYSLEPMYPDSWPDYAPPNDDGFD